ncbi:BZ3500_MvSof-1268-A1-R1_Chr12-2g03868 [Microbotryum saponariae]|uniref:BZ3500_MvSof-1268-A1-R1_Chr12-2g03868 protein n=1 Tax=Microbotryum saponariae TaxID=289078 RepID=A0A2X0KL07_9BASI|nr:BZ3500_MvSof-1268-A1-R1_Chr12-2g03868 [Microbotryum saponariae]
MSVQLLHSHNIRYADSAPSQPPRSSSFLLGPLDSLVTPTIPIAILFVYTKPAHHASSSFMPLQRITQALSIVLASYPHLTGRLELHPQTGVRSITDLNKGANLLEANCSELLDEWIVKHPPGTSPRDPSRTISKTLFAPFQPTLGYVCNHAVLTIQHTTFACGGVSLGFRWLHTLCDAQGSIQFVQDFARVYRERGEEFERGPCIESFMSSLGSFEKDERKMLLDFKPEKYHIDQPTSAETEPTSPKNDNSDNSDEAPDETSDPVVGRFIHFTATSLLKIKATATDPTSKSWISTFDALSAHLLQRVYLSRTSASQRRAEDNPSTAPLPNFLTPLNLRSRLGEALLPPRYFGNALQSVYTDLDPLLLATPNSLSELARQIHSLTDTTLNTSFIRSTLRTLSWIALQPNKLLIRDEFEYRPGGTLMLSHWGKFDVYNPHEFGFERGGVGPSRVMTPFTETSLVDGLGYLLHVSPGIEGRGLELALALQKSTWDVLDLDPVWGKFVANQFVQ